LILRVYPSQQQTFTKNDIYFLQAVANVLAAAIELQRVETARKNIQAELHQQYRRSQLFADITLKIRQSLQIDEILLARSKLILLSRFSSKINCGDS
jgi:GAF domain-containing protein